MRRRQDWIAPVRPGKIREKKLQNNRLDLQLLLAKANANMPTLGFDPNPPKSPRPAYQYIGFIVTPTDVHDYTVDFQVDEIEGYTEDPATGEYTVPSETLPYLTCMIKWDSCSHFTFGDGGGYLHLCGVRDQIRHLALMHHLYTQAFMLMRRAPEKSEEWPKTDEELAAIVKTFG